MAEAAHALGHVLSPPDVDTEDSLVGYCKRCVIPFATDGGEAPFHFSVGLSGPCQPTVVDRVAVVDDNGITYHGWRT